MFALAAGIAHGGGAAAEGCLLTPPQVGSRACSGGSGSKRSNHRVAPSLHAAQPGGVRRRGLRADTDTADIDTAVMVVVEVVAAVVVAVVAVARRTQPPLTRPDQPTTHTTRICGRYQVGFGIPRRPQRPHPAAESSPPQI